MSETRKDFIAAILFFLMGIGVNVSALMIKDPGLSEMGPREFPRFIGTCMMVLSMALFLKTVSVYQKQKKRASPGNWPVKRRGAVSQEGMKPGPF